MIDYFSELTFLRDGDSINFQKASCTLDGCVKIYSSRVDSVAEQTEKLLTGLAPGQGSSLANHREEELDDDRNDNGNNNNNNNGMDDREIKSRKRNSRTSGKTLEKNLDNLIVKQFDQECCADPFFKKMCAQFDEMGSMAGMLQTTLPMQADTFSLILEPSVKLSDLNFIHSIGEEQNQLSENALLALGI